MTVEMNGRPFLRMNGIWKSYNGTQALIDVDFEADLGEVHAIVGENGAGKSTLVKILGGAIQQDRGQIHFGDHEVVINSPQDAQALGARAVHQEFSLISHLSVTENILLGEMPTRGLRWWVDWPKANLAAQAILDSIGFSGIDVRGLVRRLSVSHQQMVEIAKAVAVRPKILILDEPSAVLSKEELSYLFALIRKVKSEGSLVLYISHRLEEVFQIADRITVLRDGEVMGTVLPEDTAERDLIRMMVGRTLDEYFPDRAGDGELDLLEVEGISRETSFSDISFRLREGEILGIFGLVGSGRTQVARAIFGAEVIERGRIKLAGKTIVIRSPQDAVDHGIAFVTEDRKRDGLVLSLSLRDNISLPNFQKVSRWGILQRSKQDRMAMSTVRSLDIRPPVPDRLVRTMSGGNQQKVVLAKWLAAEARVLILDEPTRGVDVATKVEIYQLMVDLTQRGAGILLISSELPEILGLSDRVLVMRDGRIVREFSRAEMAEEAILGSAAGLASEHSEGVKQFR